MNYHSSVFSVYQSTRETRREYEHASCFRLIYLQKKATINNELKLQLLLYESNNIRHTEEAV